MSFFNRNKSEGSNQSEAKKAYEQFQDSDEKLMKLEIQNAEQGGDPEKVEKLKAQLKRHQQRRKR